MACDERLPERGAHLFFPGARPTPTSLWYSLFFTHIPGFLTTNGRLGNSNREKCLSTALHRLRTHRPARSLSLRALPRFAGNYLSRMGGERPCRPERGRTQESVA